MSIADRLKHICDTNPDKLAFVGEDRSLTYRDFDSETTKLASVFAETLQTGKGQRIILSLPNSVDYIVCLFAAFKAGVTVVPANPMLKVHEIQHVFQDSGASVLITSPEFLEQIRNLEELGNLKHLIISGPAPTGFEGLQVHTLADVRESGEGDFQPVQTDTEDIATIFYTSGTTGKPKGAMLSYPLIISHGDSTVDAVHMSPEDRHICVLPMAHLFGQDLAIIPPVLSGGTVYIVESFDAGKVLSVLAENRITVMAGVNTMYARMVEVPNAKDYDLSSLRAVIAGAAALFAEVSRQFKETFDIDILPAYGSTETSVVTVTPPEGPIKTGSIGKPIPGVAVSVQDEGGNILASGETGELMVSKDCVMSGYLNLPEANKESFRGDWYHTGDIITMDEEDYIFIVGRKKEMINTSGYSVFPKEVEDIISRWNKVKEVAVVGLPDQVRGEIVAAFVVPASPDMTADDVLSFCQDNLATYKIPRQVELLQDLPKTSTGKIEKKALRERYGSGQSN
jgi:long-chain acyl-CoA synthetase